MLGGVAGSIQAMITSLKNNKMLLKRRKSFKEIREFYNTKSHTHRTTYKKADKKILEAIREELKRERKKEIVKTIIIMIISVAITLLLFYGAYKILML